VRKKLEERHNEKLNERNNNKRMNSVTKTADYKQPLMLEAQAYVFCILYVTLRKVGIVTHIMNIILHSTLLCSILFCSNSGQELPQGVVNCEMRATNKLTYLE